jgi:hypothetical protein
MPGAEATCGFTKNNGSARKIQWFYRVRGGKSTAPALLRAASTNYEAKCINIPILIADCGLQIADCRLIPSLAIGPLQSAICNFEIFLVSWRALYRILAP